MALDDPIKFFRVIVGDEIRVEREPGSKDLGKCAVRVDPLQRRTAQVLITMLREGRLRDAEEYKVLGANLYRVLFDNAIGTALRETFFQRFQFMRVELEFEEGQEILSSWPWEYLYCPEEYGQAGSGYFLANKAKLILTRRLRLDSEPKLRIDTPPLKVLFVASGPKEHDVEYERVLEAIESLGPKMVKVTSLLPREKPDRIAPKATWRNFTAMLRTQDFDAIHFLGHGKWEWLTSEAADLRKGRGTIVFMNPNDTEDPHSEDEVASKLMDLLHCLRLVFLQACESAQSDPYQAFSGLAQQLAQKGIPAVVGLQTKILQQVANRFASEFYQALADKLTVDAALQKARMKIVDESSDPTERLGFGLPVLYLRESDSLFPPDRPASTPTSIQSKTFSEFLRCPWCPSDRNTPDDYFCGECDGALVCSKCETRVDRQRNTCRKCGEPLRQPATVPLSPPASPPAGSPPPFEPPRPGGGPKLN